MTNTTPALSTTPPPIEIRDIGFTILADSDSSVADIVLIHGLQGHPQWTWTDPPPTRNVRKEAHDTRKPDLGKLMRGLFSRSKSPSTHNADPIIPSTHDPQPRVYWPAELLRIDYPNCRIMTYGYDSQVTHWFRGPAMQLDIFSYGESLLNGLEAKRRADPDRPLIYIVHSLGGLILKDGGMLRRSRTAIDPALRSIYTSSHAIIFLGTPHRGGSYVDLGLTARKIVACSGLNANDKLLRDLKFDSSTAKLLREEFAKMLEEIKPAIYTFQEGLGLSGFGPLSGKVVEDTSSALDYSRERKDYIHANHVNMCRFRSSSNDGYDKIRSAISACLLNGQSNAGDSAQEMMRQRILSTLSTPEASERFEQVETAYEKTCEFLFENKSLGFVKWLQAGRGIYFISGKPGSGKSTLMKFIVSDRRTFEHLYKDSRSGKLLWAAFFFTNRGTTNQKSLSGLLREILHGLLSQASELLQFIQPVYEHHVRVQGVWLQHYLRTALMNIVAQRKVRLKICLFIDALDESSDEYSETHGLLLAVLDDLVVKADANYVKIKLCLSSRPENVFVDSFQKYPGFPIHEHTLHDIEAYVHGRMSTYLTRRHDLTSDPQAPSTLTGICDEVVRRAQGVFLWVRLIMTDLIEGLIDGDSTLASQKHLSSIPGDGDLQELYYKILTRLRPEYLLEAYCMLQIAYAALEPFSLSEFFEATQFTKEPYLEDSWITSSPPVLERRITSRCRGFLEVQHATVHSTEGESKKTQVVQFLHQSAKDFLAKTGSFSEIARQLNLRIHHDGHVFLLEYRVEQHLRRWRNQVGVLKTVDSFDLLRFGVFEHARQVERAVEQHVIESEGIFRPLDRLASFSDAHDLASTYLRYHGWKCPEEWRPNFMAMAIMAGLVIFVSQHIEKIDNMSRKPFLHWAVSPQPPGLVGQDFKPFILSTSIVSYLVKTPYVDLHQEFEGQTAFACAFKEYQRHRKNNIHGAPSRSAQQGKVVLQILLEHGSEVDCFMEMRMGPASSDLQLPWDTVSNRDIHGLIKREIIITPLALAIRQADHNLTQLLLKHGANYRLLAPDDWAYLAQIDKVMLQLVKTYMSNDDRNWAEVALKHLMAEDIFAGPQIPGYDTSDHVRRAWN